MFWTAQALGEAVDGCWRNGRGAAVSGVFTDTRRSGKGKLFCALAGEKFDAHDFLDKAIEAGAAALCVRKGTSVPDESIPVLEVADTLCAYQALAKFRRASLPELKTIGVTGSVGKTSVKEMLRAVFSAVAGEENVLATEGNTNNHVGVPQNLLKLEENHRYAILEMGMNHRGEILPLTLMTGPDAAVINSIAPCHVENLGSLEGIAIEKGDIFQGLSSGGTAVIPYGLPQTELLIRAAGNRRICFFGTGDACDVKARYRGGKMDGSCFDLTFRDAGTFTVNWSLSGCHQAVNAAAAAAAAWSLGVAPETICAALPRTVLPGMRSKITRAGEITYINDAYNANPASMAAALDYLGEFADPGHLILLLGAMLELGDVSLSYHENLLVSARKRFPGARIFAFGRPFAPAAEKLGVPFYEHPADFEKILAETIVPGDIVFAKGSRGIGVEKALPQEAR